MTRRDNPPWLSFVEGRDQDRHGDLWDSPEKGLSLQKICDGHGYGGRASGARMRVLLPAHSAAHGDGRALRG